MKRLTTLFAVLTAGLAVSASAQLYIIAAGWTSIEFDDELVEIFGVDIDVSSPVLFPLPGFDASFPITSGAFTYTLPGLGYVSGTMEHFTSSVTGTLPDTSSATASDFVIAFDPGRVSGTTSGYVLSATVDGFSYDVADLGAGFGVTQVDDQVTVDDITLLVHEDLAALLGLPSFAGIEVGNAQIDAVVRIIPEPGALALFGFGAFLMLAALRRRA